MGSASSRGASNDSTDAMARAVGPTGLVYAVEEARAEYFLAAVEFTRSREFDLFEEKFFAVYLRGS